MGLVQVDQGDDQLQMDCRWQLGSVRATVVDCWAKHKLSLLKFDSRGRFCKKEKT